MSVAALTGSAGTFGDGSKHTRKLLVFFAVAFLFSLNAAPTGGAARRSINSISSIAAIASVTCRRMGDGCPCMLAPLN